MAFKKALAVTYTSPCSLYGTVHRSVHHSTLTREVFFLLYILTQRPISQRVRDFRALNSTWNVSVTLLPSKPWYPCGRGGRRTVRPRGDRLLEESSIFQTQLGSAQMNSQRW